MTGCCKTGKICALSHTIVDLCRYSMLSSSTKKVHRLTDCEPSLLAVGAQAKLTFINLLKFFIDKIRISFA